ncbi:MAG: N-acetyltransferase, partial [Gammaproteobacteria bacterium]
PWGWQPRHLLVYSGTRLVAACPLYLKTNSYGEFVFDWNWAEFWERNGHTYYPKLVSTVPYTPAAGPRLLTDPEHPQPDRLRALLIEGARQLATETGCSGMHWLFTCPVETRQLAESGMALRMGCQYHWHNDGYANFDDFLDRLSSKKRKNIRRERRKAHEHGLRIQRLYGREIEERHWDSFHAFYLRTFTEKWGYPTLSRTFFSLLSERMPESLLLVMAFDGDRAVAGALDLIGEDTLYGRYWGCLEQHDLLHFEVSYYQGIEFAIEHRLARFEPGAQGEHKIPRGFLPTPTWSAHWIRDDRLRPMIERFCRHEQQMMREECRALYRLSPFRDDALPASQHPEALGLEP